MPVLYVENVPPELYDALRLRAKSEGRSISSEVMNLLSANVPTPAVLARRRRVFELARRIGKKQPSHPTPAESAEDMLRSDRER